MSPFLLDSIPPWLLVPLLLLAFTGAIAIGWRLGQRRKEAGLQDGGFMANLFELSDVHNLRTDIRWNRIPPPVFITLFVLSCFGMALLGHILGLTGNLAPLGTGLLVVTYAIVLTVVIDLDRHTSGIFSVSQQPVVEVRDNLLAP